MHIPYYKFKQVQPKTRKIIFKFYLISYCDMNVTVFSKRCPAIIYIYIDEVQQDVSPPVYEQERQLSSIKLPTIIFSTGCDDYLCSIF